MNKLCRPVGKRFGPILPSNEEVKEASEWMATLPEEIQAYFKWAEENLSLTPGDFRVACTEAVLKWCRNIKRIRDASFELTEATYRAPKRAKYDYQAEQKRDEQDKAFLARYVQRNFPSYENTVADHAELVAKRAAEQSAEEAPDEETQPVGFE